MWIPHSSFWPCHCPERRLPGSMGRVAISLRLRRRKHNTMGQRDYVLSASLPRCVVIGEGGPKGPPLRPWEASPRFRVSALRRRLRAPRATSRGAARGGVLLRLNVDPAFELLALPAAGARVVRVGGRRGARLAADARVAE